MRWDLSSLPPQTMKSQPRASAELPSLPGEPHGPTWMCCCLNLLPARAARSPELVLPALLSPWELLSCPGVAQWSLHGCQSHLRALPQQNHPGCASASRFLGRGFIPRKGGRNEKGLEICRMCKAPWISGQSTEQAITRQAPVPAWLRVVRTRASESRAG